MNRKGALCAIGAYGIWGLFPIYWKLLKHVPTTQLTGHRMIWSFLVLAVLVAGARRWRELRSLALNRKAIQIYSLAALLIGMNWFLFVWAVNAGYVMECSLGYFINPLLNVLLGVALLRERLRPFQWVSVGLAALGVAYLTFAYGRLPWIALSLALTFAFYGLVKKHAPLNSMYGLTLESGILFLPGLLFLIHQDWTGQGAFLHGGAWADLLMAGAGPITVIPLLMFASAARLIPLSTIGIFQYITPTSQFLLGVLVYNEAFDAGRAVGFGIVWAGVAVFCADSLLSRRVIPPPAELVES